ncbi:HD domain-containing phosphohydrolase [Falsibacillus albus]|uniref:HD domain-containing protein n=1 Tax=Falsibacillus albus TaxID=2478915 RepID=A0A3L7JXE5_9BACI|nr:HD domain-containing phosphohydrolase [Falsibacillus albus]RLQ95436.1 HD domain-containing protein [Falsibacillus albus]
MSIYTQFKKRMLFNYLIGSLVAVLGIGSIFIFQTLNLSATEVKAIWFILAFSLCVMLSSEMIVYRLHLKPLYEIYVKGQISKNQLLTAYKVILQFPYLTVKRILLPHFLGLAIPSIVLTLIFIRIGILKIPYSFIILAFIGALLIASMHALIEFFLTQQSIRAIILDLQERSMSLYQSTLASDQHYFFSIKRKLLIGALFLSLFPVLLFSLATQVRFVESSIVVSNEYLSWAAIIIFVIILFSITGAILLYKSIQKPLLEMQLGFKEVQEGSISMLPNHHTDEFAELIHGFNHMILSIKLRDKQNSQLLDSFFTVIAAALDARDPYTAGHSQRVADYSLLIGEKAQLSADQLNWLVKSALLHDIGKIGIKDDILLKDGKLTNEEFNQIKEHPLIGAQILSEVNLPENMRQLLPGIKHHHERVDGKGYPSGLAGKDIPVFGRIIAIADAYDAMTSNRPYRKGMNPDKALAIINDGRGTQWDEHYAGIFLEIMGSRSSSNDHAEEMIYPRVGQVKNF